MVARCLTERRIPKSWKETDTVIFFQEREQSRNQELRINLLAMKYLQTVHTNHNI